MADLRLRLNLLWLIIHHTISPHNVHHTDIEFSCVLVVVHNANAKWSK